MPGLKIGFGEVLGTRTCEVSHKPDMAGPFSRGDTIINKIFTFTVIHYEYFKVAILITLSYIILSDKCNIHVLLFILHCIAIEYK